MTLVQPPMRNIAAAVGAEEDSADRRRRLAALERRHAS